MSIYDIPARVQRVAASGVAIPDDLAAKRDRIVHGWVLHHGTPAEVRWAEEFDLWLQHAEHLVKMERTCRAKVKWGTRKEAAARAKSAGRRFGIVYRYYHCPNCGEYHLTRVKPEAAA